MEACCVAVGSVGVGRFRLLSWGQSVLEEPGQVGQGKNGKEGKGVQTHLVDVGGEGVRSVCEGGRHGASFNGGRRGAGQPLRMTVFCSKRLLHATGWQVMRWGVFFFLQLYTFMCSS